MLRVIFRRVKAGKEARLRDWLADLQVRAEEVRETFLDETVRGEQAFLLETTEGLVLVYAMEAENFSIGQAAFAQSKHAIDEQHKQVMKECLGDRLEVEHLYDVALKDPDQDDS